MPVKINGASSGSVTLAAPSSGSDVTLTLPTTALATTASVNTAVAPMGLVAVAPTSIANSGGSASLSNYTVSFSGVSSVSLNGVFSGDYDNYRLIVDVESMSGENTVYTRFRASGSDATGSNYESTAFYFYGGPTSGIVHFAGVDYGWLGTISADGLITADIAWPAVARNTVANVQRVAAQASVAKTVMTVGGLRHTVATAYDGITLYPNTGTFTGSLSIYGYKK